MPRTPQSQAGAAGHTPEPGQGEREQRKAQREEGGSRPQEAPGLQGSAAAQRQDATTRQDAPVRDTWEEKIHLRVSVDLPGVPKDAVTIDIHEDMLTIQGERREERAEAGEQKGLRRTERRSFYLSIPLPNGADADRARARMKEGVLEITIPLAQKRGRRLQIGD